MTDPSAEAIRAARRALSRFDRYGPTHGDLTHEIAVEIDDFAVEAQRATIAECLLVISGVRDKPARSLDWCNALNEAQEGIRALADKPAAGEGES